jgi:protein-tyrosine phosphatase
MLKWILPAQLAISPRPGYGPGAEFGVPREAVERWSQEMKAAGISSIICLLAGDQLPLYDRALPDGLLRYYEQAGFQVAHIATVDGQKDPFTAAQLQTAWSAYSCLPKPVLVHCSAGFDRTGRVIDHLLDRLHLTRHSG